ncbi:Gfo/Idh/MocA family oxidoreductase [Modestobacter muralis]|uniref:Gfo/Idh/MocA family oxidoreductase n=1 Tax=Modestobacter muralis TaxID=1608614 RepID=A0A6P0H2P8_9ACTN|nr:Gfo/Idh/MocA family oxidoreductase [Modestobacter muralis]NEK93124.1 Gfo/Idh/MocA family oxidoreductase [Modestobacter muralis]NEN49891.1 Gfo/Idh/MocA family oxidoreductase [Modestobacter muralis]
MTSPYIARPELLDADPLTATGRPVGWGVVSTGSIAATVTADIALLPDATLAAVSSRHADKAAAFAEQFGFAASYGDDDTRSGLDALLADPAVEVVYVATPHAQHAAVVRAALTAGKSVLVEKPITINAREATELAELARERGVFLMEAVWTRFQPAYQRALQIAASGELGQVHWVNAEISFPAPADPGARIWARADGGGALLDLAVYPLLWPWGTIGLPDSVTAVGTLNEEGVDAQNALSLSYASGAQAQLTTSLLARSPHSALVCGTEGWLRAEGADSVYRPERLEVQIGDAPVRVEEFERIGSGYVHELREVTRCLQQGLTESPVMPVHDSLALMHFLDGVRAQLGVVYPND